MASTLLDVERFRAFASDGASEEALEAAAALARGDFLEGFSVRDSPEFDDWQLAEADALRREQAAVLRRLVELLAARGAYPRAIARARRWLALDPLHEPAHRQLIRLYAWSGDRGGAQPVPRLRASTQSGARCGPARADHGALRAGQRGHAAAA